MAVWSWVMGALKDETISLSVLGLLVLMVWYSFVWATEEHAHLVDRSDFDELSIKMDDHTEEFRIVSAQQLLRDIKLRLQLSKATNASPAEIATLEEQKIVAENYKNCLVNRSPNCEHIKPQE